MIREIRKEDYELYMEMTEEFYNSDATDHVIPREYREATWQELMRSKEYARAYMLELEGTVAGYALLSITFSQEAGGMVVWIEELYVRPEFQGNGLGKEFFAYVDEKIAPQIMRVRLEVEADNLGAKKLYRNMGYTQLPYEQMIKEVQEVK